MLFNLFGKKKDKPSSEKKSKYQDLRVHTVTRETADAISISFEPPADDWTYEAGQFLTLILTIDGEEVRRSYSLCTAPGVDPYPTVTVKRVASGKVSNYLNDTLQVGDTVRTLAPMGTFTVATDAEQQRHLIMFGGGSGITPLMGIIKAVLQNEPRTHLSLIYANRNAASIIFRQQLADLQQQHPDRLHVTHVLEDAADHPGALEGQVLASRVPTLLADLPYEAEATEYFLCGPQGMMDEIREALRGLDIPPHLVHRESFVVGTPKAEPVTQSDEAPASDWDSDGPPGAYQGAAAQVTEAHEVTVRYEGETHQFTVEPSSTILETALALDIDLPFSCQSGLCTACMGKCVSGRMKLDEEDSLTEDDLKQGYVLTCVGHPLTSDVVIEID